MMLLEAAANISIQSSTVIATRVLVSMTAVVDKAAAGNAAVYMSAVSFVRCVCGWTVAMV